MTEGHFEMKIGKIAVFLAIDFIKAFIAPEQFAKTMQICTELFSVSSNIFDKIL